jgi:dihydroorotate dehydrogenase (NAD+) catalytic subunit
VAVRAVFDVHQALPDLPIVGVGGVASGTDAAELVLAGASAVQVGTATFAHPRAPARVRDELAAWAARQGVAALSELVGAVAAPWDH